MEELELTMLVSLSCFVLKHKFASTSSLEEEELDE